MNTKVCNKCKKEKYITLFNFRKKKENKRRGTCKDCRNAQQKNWRDLNKKAIKNYNLKLKFGINIDEYNELYNSQCSCCAICKSTKPLYKYFNVDHCHITAEVRGLLCHRCNKALGLFKENINNLRHAIDYLVKDYAKN